MRDSIKKAGERLLIMLIVGVSTAVLCQCLWNDDKITADAAVSAVLIAAFIMMTKAMIKNLYTFVTSGEFFGTRGMLAGMGALAYIGSRVFWGYLMVYFIFIDYLSGGEDLTGGDVLFMLSCLIGVVSVIIGAVFFRMRASNKKEPFERYTPDKLVEMYGCGDSEYTVIAADRFLDTDELSYRVTAILTNNDPYYADKNNGTPFALAIEDGFLFPMPRLLPRDFGSLVRQSRDAFLKPLNNMIRFTDRELCIDAKQWEQELKSSADTCLINRLRDHIGVDYFILNCAEHLLRDRGYALVQFTFKQGGSYVTIMGHGTLNELKRLDGTATD